MPQLAASAAPHHILWRLPESGPRGTRGELGAAVSIVLDGKPLVDLWGGHADKAKTRAWQRDTLINVYKSEFAGTNKATALTFQVADIDKEVSELKDKGIQVQAVLPGATSTEYEKGLRR